MNTAELKADLYKLIEKTDDVSILEALRTLLKKQITPDKAESDFWDELPDALKSEIDEGLSEIENEPGKPHEEVARELKGRYNIEL